MDSTFNELIYITLSLYIFMIMLITYRKYNSKSPIMNTPMFVFIFITSSFICIPVNEFTAGFASIITYPSIVHRFYFSSLLFMGIPLIIYYMLMSLGIEKISIINSTIAILIIGTFFYSKNVSNTHNYYKNILSIYTSFDERKVGFNLSNKQILSIKKQLDTYNNAPLYFYAREDIAFILKQVYHQKVHLVQHWRGKKLGTGQYIQNYHKDIKHKNKVLFPVPEGFPSYESYK